MSRRGPLITLGSVVLLALILFVTNSRVAKPSNTAVGARAAPAPLHALFAGRSSGNEVTVAIAVNGRKAAAELNAGQRGEASLQGSVTGNRIALTGSNGAGLAGSISGPGVFGMVTASRGHDFPFSAQQAVVHAVYAGRSSGNEVTLAISTNGDKATAYVCNGQTLEAWLQGSVTGNQVTLTGRDGADLTGSISGLAMFGTVTVSAGRSFPFSAELAAHPAGVYQADVTINGLATRIGWAVLPDGAQAGVAVAGGTKHPAPPLDLSNDSFTVGGTSFKASPVAGTQTVVTR